MPSAIPPPLASYIESCLIPTHSQTLITSVLNAPSPWLCLRFLYGALYGVGDEVETRDFLAARQRGSNDSMPVVFVSLLRPLNLWIEMGKKMGLDLQALLHSNKIAYVGGLSYGVSPTGPAEISRASTTKLKGLALDDLRHAVTSALDLISPSTLEQNLASSTPTSRIPLSSSAAPSIPKATKPLVLLDGLDFLLACQPSFSTVALQSFLSALRAKSHALVLTGNADAPLVQTATSANRDGGTPLERDQAHFLTSMAHQSKWVFQLRALDTGSAKDVSGVIRVSRGGNFEADEEDEIKDTGNARVGGMGDLPDVEWLYQLKGDGTVKIWGRGE